MTGRTEGMRMEEDMDANWHQDEELMMARAEIERLTKERDDWKRLAKLAVTAKDTTPDIVECARCGGPVEYGDCCNECDEPSDH